MKRKIALLLTVACALSLYGCGKETTRENTDVSAQDARANVSDTAAMEDTGDREADAEPDAVLVATTEPVADEDDTLEYSEEAIEEYSCQFLQYSALCMEYPETFCGEYLDENMMIYAIAYTEALGATSDTMGVDYDPDNGLPVIPKDRFEELSQRFFGLSVNVDMLPMIDEADPFESHVSRDEVGNVYVAVGDWGTVGPMVDDVEITVEDELTTAVVTVMMFDYEENQVADILGTYTLKLKASEEEYCIIDYTFDFQ